MNGGLRRGVDKRSVVWSCVWCPSRRHLQCNHMVSSYTHHLPAKFSLVMSSLLLTFLLLLFVYVWPSRGAVSAIIRYDHYPPSHHPMGPWS